MDRYSNFDLELSNYVGGDGAVETFEIRVLGSPAGEQRRAEAVTVQVSAGLREECQRLDRRELDLAGLLSVGRTLGDLLFPPATRSYWLRSLAKLPTSEGLRLRLRLDSWALAALPWEYAWLPTEGAPARSDDVAGFLALDRRISIVRYEMLGEPAGRLEPIGDAPLRLVAVMASPDSPDLPRLDLEREAAALRRALETRPEVDLEILSEGSRPALDQALEHGGQVFHFAGHGRFQAAMAAKPGSVEGRGFLVFRDRTGKPDEVDGDELVISLRGRGVRLAVLGACLGARRDSGNPWQGIAPALVRSGLPAVVAMQATLFDESAVAFSARCYEMLAEGVSIDDAVTAGRLAIFNEVGASNRDWGVPVLYMRADSGVLFPRSAADAEGPLGRRGWINLAIFGALILLVLGLWVLAKPWIPALWPIEKFAIAISAAVGGAYAWLQWLAGDPVRAWVRRFLLRRRTTIFLAVAAIAVTAADLPLFLNRPVVVRVIPGLRLTQSLPGPDTPGYFVYNLSVWQGRSEREEPDWELANLHKAGGALGTSTQVERGALDRQKDAVIARLREHFLRQLDAPIVEELLKTWTQGERARPGRAGPLRRTGQPLRFELVKMEGGVETEKPPLVQTLIGKEGGIEIVVVELERKN
jgi:hypothetical protein